VPANLPWKETGPRRSNQPAARNGPSWGREPIRTDGPLPNDNLSASVLLPMGRFGAGVYRL